MSLDDSHPMTNYDILDVVNNFWHVFILLKINKYNISFVLRGEAL